MIKLQDIKAAAAHIAGHVRHTPVLRADCTRDPVTEAQLFLKLELMQPSGSFKVRGVTNKLSTLPEGAMRGGLVTASGGNHGLALARAGYNAGVITTVFLPSNVTPAKRERFVAWNARTEVVNGSWDVANEAALAFAERHGATHIHPFRDPLVVAGQGTIGLELLEAIPHLDVVIVAIGGGGLAAGLGTALKALKPSVRVVGVEPVGSPTHKRSQEAGRVVTLPEITTKVATMACARTDEWIYDRVKRAVDEIVLVEDGDMQRAAEWLWFEFGLAADLSGAAGVAALQAGSLRLAPGTVAATLICGAGPDGIAS